MKRLIGLIILAGLIWMIWPSTEVKISNLWTSDASINIEGNEYYQLSFDHEYESFSFRGHNQEKLNGTFKTDGEELALYFNDECLTFDINLKNRTLSISDPNQYVVFDKFKYDPSANTTSESRIK